MALVYYGDSNDQKVARVLPSGFEESQEVHKQWVGKGPDLRGFEEIIRIKGLRMIRFKKSKR